VGTRLALSGLSSSGLAAKLAQARLRRSITATALRKAKGPDADGFKALRAELPRSACRIEWKRRAFLG